uniref:Type-1 restriction enzyme MjaXIP specificity protein n=1 Tax=Candidatus Methanophagaceae archaeon ANME-1 ERB6 TaxID=2759912 RepID=A0A7G9YSH3_9EURY|nr:type-1 restriction enzyme MjaXIP specificity protein [Methanosarcinales archaeon ANME-1 ERB6]
MEMNEISGDFKMTELGPLPEEWTVVPLQKLNSQKKVSLNPANFPDEIFEYYSIPNYQNSKKPSFEQGASILSQKILLNNGAVLFGKLNPRVEKVWKVESDTQHRKIGSTEWFPIFPDNEKVDSDFLYYVEWSKYVMPKAKTLVTGSTPSRQRVDQTSFYKIKIPLPPLSEQQKIAKVLSTVQEAKEKSDAVIIATKDLKKSLMHKLFAEGLNGEEQKETEIGLIPERWDVMRLGDITEKTKQTDQRKNPNNKFKYIDVSGISNKFFQIVEFKEYLGKEAPNRARKMIKANDIIFATVRPYLKRVAIVPDAFDGEICSTAFCVVRCKREIANPIFVFNCLLNDTFVDKVSELQRGSSYPAVTDKDVLNQKIPFPPLSEQQQIAHILSTVDKKIGVEERRKNTLKELFKTMLHKLMSGEKRLKEVEI